MQRIEGPGATPDNKFTEGDPSLGVSATTVTANFMNGVQEELVHILEEAGVTPDNADLTQVLGALQILFVRKDASGMVPTVGEQTWTSLVSGITSTLKTKKMPDNTLHFYGKILKASDATYSMGYPLLVIPRNPFGIDNGKYIGGFCIETWVPSEFSITYNATADRTELVLYTSWDDSATHNLSIWQVVPCLGLD